MMYTEQNRISAAARAKRGILITAALFAAGALMLTLGLITRNRIVGTGGLIAGCVIAYAYLMLKAMPWIKYRDYLNDVFSGLSRETEGRFDSVASEARLSDGVAVRDVVLRVADGEEGERLFYWDDEFPFPAIEQGCPLRVTSFGRYITKIDRI